MTDMHPIKFTKGNNGWTGLLDADRSIVRRQHHIRPVFLTGTDEKPDKLTVRCEHADKRSVKITRRIDKGILR